MTLTTGDAVPVFAAEQENTQPYVPTPGHWRVLFFFPKTATTHCQLQARRYQALIDDFRALNTDVVGINGDPQMEQLRFRYLCHLDYPVLSDTQHVISQMFGVLDEPWPDETVRRPKRETFLVDPAGIIRAHWQNVEPGHDAATVLKAAQALIGGDTPTA